MKTELMRTMKKPLYWIVLGAGLSTRLMFGWMDHMYRGADFLSNAANFWSKIGSITIGMLILLVLIHPFAMDKETGTQPIIASASCGRKSLFLNRLFAGNIAAALGVMLLCFGNIMITLLIGRHSQALSEWLSIFLRVSVIALIGTEGFYLFSACVCDILQNHAAAICVCGIFFSVRYILNASIIHRFEAAWFLFYGTFTELARGKIIDDLPAFWLLWYIVLLIGIFIFAINRRKERKEL